MKAMILAAGLGTRLRPLTERRPKVLVPVAGRMMIDRTIALLKESGVTEVVVNAHHHARRVVEYLDGGRPFDIPVQVRVEPEILGTAGGIRNTADFWDGRPFVVINGDILTDIDLRAAVEAHVRAETAATLVLHHCPRFSKIRVDDKGTVTGISRKVRPGRLAFTGIHILDRRGLSYLARTRHFDIMEVYRDWIRGGKRLGSHVVRSPTWYDIGSLPDYLRANREALGPDKQVMGPHCRVHPGATIEDWAVMGEGTVVEAGARIARSVIWDRATVHQGVNIADSVVTDDREVRSDLVGGAL